MGCPSVLLTCKVGLPSCYGITIDRTVNIGSTCSPQSRPTIMGSGPSPVEVPMFILSNPAPDMGLISVTFSNVILSGHTVTPEITPPDLNDVDRFGRAAAISSPTGGVTIILKAVTITGMDAGAGALALYGQPGTRRGNLTVTGSTISNNTGGNIFHAAGFTVRDSATVRISATTFTTNKGFAAPQTLNSASTLWVEGSDGVYMQASTLRQNYIDIRNSFAVFTATALIYQVRQVSVISSTFAENIGDSLIIQGDPANPSNPSSTLFMKASTFLKNTGALTGGLAYYHGAVCISATSFTSNTAVGLQYNSLAGNGVYNTAAGALYVSNAMLTGSVDNFQGNRVAPQAMAPNTPYWAQSIFVGDGASAVFITTTVDASGVPSPNPPDVTAGGNSALFFCKSTFVQTPKTMIPLNLAAVGDIDDVTVAVGSIDVCPTTPYSVSAGIVTAMCNTCNTVGTTDCGRAVGWAWLPWLRAIYPNYWQSGLGAKGRVAGNVGFNPEL